MEQKKSFRIGKFNVIDIIAVALTLAVALYAAALWETGQTDGELLCSVARRPDTVLA